jgi:hypothetical protein
MPKILDEAVKSIMKKKGISKSSAYAIAISTLQKAGDLKKGTYKTTKKGSKRAQMTKKQRKKTQPVGAAAKKRAAKKRKK